MFPGTLRGEVDAGGLHVIAAVAYWRRHPTDNLFRYLFRSLGICCEGRTRDLGTALM
jgi:hypothetical protein